MIRHGVFGKKSFQKAPLHGRGTIGWLVGLIGWSLVFVAPAAARHKCPEPPVPNTPLMTTSYYPTVTSLYPSDISNTSGCERGHPSDDFYRPKGAWFYQENVFPLAEEAAQGSGPHLDAFAGLLQCSSEGKSALSSVMKARHSLVFPKAAFRSPEQTEQAWPEVQQTLLGNPQVAAGCPTLRYNG